MSPSTKKPLCLRQMLGEHDFRSPGGDFHFGTFPYQFPMNLNCLAWEPASCLITIRDQPHQQMRWGRGECSNGGSFILGRGWLIPWCSYTKRLRQRGKGEEIRRAPDLPGQGDWGSVWKEEGTGLGGVRHRRERWQLLCRPWVLCLISSFPWKAVSSPKCQITLPGESCGLPVRMCFRFIFKRPLKVSAGSFTSATWVWWVPPAFTPGGTSFLPLCGKWGISQGEASVLSCSVF